MAVRYPVPRLESCHVRLTLAARGCGRGAGGTVRLSGTAARRANGLAGAVCVRRAKTSCMSLGMVYNTTPAHAFPRLHTPFSFIAHIIPYSVPSTAPGHL